MPNSKLRILTISPSSDGGGAELVARSLHQSYLMNGEESWLAVGSNQGTWDRIIQIENDRKRNLWVRFWHSLIEKWDANSLHLKGLGFALRGLRTLGQLGRWRRTKMGVEDFDFPGSWNLDQRIAGGASIVHAHNLHGNYFDLRSLKTYAKAAPLFISLHDAWLLSGHCAHSFNCEKWQTGCGACPDLSLYPAIKADASALNWQRKHAIFAGIEIYLSAPSEWLLSKAKSSLLAGAIKQSKVIPNGIDTKIYYPRSKQQAREALDIEHNAKVIMIAANGIRANLWKDYKTLRQAIARLGSFEKLIVLAVGDSASVERVGSSEIRFLDFTNDSNLMASYYSAADLYVHAAKVESFGNVMLEARACGVPVVASAVGGIPEHLSSIEWAGLPSSIKPSPLSLADGVLVAEADPEALSSAIALLLEDESLRQQLASNGLRNVTQKYDLQFQTNAYLEWYRDVLSERETNT